MEGSIRKAARFHGRKDIRIEYVPEPELRAGAVKIDDAWCGICGTDLHEYLEGPIFVPAPGHANPLSREEAPVTLGHESSGTVSEVGEGVTSLAKGGQRRRRSLFCLRRMRFLPGGQLPPVPQDGVHRANRPVSAPASSSRCASVPLSCNPNLARISKFFPGLTGRCQQSCGNQ
jgi:NADPH:quinone reductase-like Zn-dependent oxidoreductase